MELNDICKKIFDICLPYANKTSNPIAYIDLCIGSSFVENEKELWTEFNKIKWDSALSSSELEFFHTPVPSLENSLVVTGVVEFEDENGNSVIHKIPESEGKIC